MFRFLLLFLCLSKCVYAAHERLDLQQKVGDHLCQKPKHLAEWLRQQGVFDAGVQVSLHKPGFDLEKISQALLKQRKHYGFLFGRCQNHTGWVLTTPAPHSLEELSLQKWCSRQEWKRASSDGNIYEIDERRPPFGEGVTGVYCWPLHDPDIGGVLWFLYPDMKTPTPVLPVIEKTQSLVLRVNTLRKKHGRMVVQHLDSKGWHQKLYDDGHVFHRHDRLRDLANRLNERHPQRHMLGENRVVGDPSTWLRQMWESPRHRALLLDKRARYISFLAKPRFLSLVMFVEERS